MKFTVPTLLAALATTSTCIAAEFRLISPKNNACVVPGKAVGVKINYTNTVTLLSVSYTAVLVYHWQTVYWNRFYRTILHFLFGYSNALLWTAWLWMAFAMILIQMKLLSIRMGHSRSTAPSTPGTFTKISRSLFPRTQAWVPQSFPSPTICLQ